MSKRETDAVAAILTDPENMHRSAEEVAELAIAALDEVRSRTHRLAVVGQVQFEAPETHTVVLGPFSARGVLDSQEKFLKATEGGSAARTAGEGIAWDSKTGAGRGRFMLAPAFRHPRDAWNFFRPKAEVDPRLLRITETIRRWEAGAWAEVASTGPACTCGMLRHPVTTSIGTLPDAGPCQRHPKAA